MSDFDVLLRGQRKQRLIDDDFVSLNTTYSSDKIEDMVGNVPAFGQNILHNWDFRNPVNQRGLVEYVLGGYTIDRWGATARIQIGVNGGIRMSNITGNQQNGLVQPIEFPHLLLGKTITLSIMLADGRILSNTGTIPTTPDVTSASVARINIDDMGGFVNLFVNSHRTAMSLAFSVASHSSYDVHAVKLEIGPISTLANDPPMDFGRELAVCQRFYEAGVNTDGNGGMAVASTTTNIDIPISYKVQKRANAIVAVEPVVQGIWFGGWQALPSVTVRASTRHGAVVRATHAIPGVQVGMSFIANLTWAASADL